MLGTRIASLRKNKKMTQENIAKRIGIPRSTYSNYEAGNREPDNETLKKIAKCLETSTDYLLGLTDDPNPHSVKDEWTPQLNEKDEKDIALRLEAIAQDIESQTSLSFNGEPMDEDTKELVLAQIERNLRLAKQLAKQKFTPKKYRKNKEDDEQE